MVYSLHVMDKFSKVTPVEITIANALGHERLQIVLATPSHFSPVIFINEPNLESELQPHLIPAELGVISRGQMTPGKGQTTPRTTAH